MDFQGFVNTFSSSCAVLSVKTGVKGHPSEIRIIVANDFYKGTMGVARYRDNMIYSDLVPKDPKFEDYCYRCAIKKQKFHYYIELNSLNCWAEITMIPIEGGSNEEGFLAFIFEATQIANPEKMSGVSPETAATVIKNCVTLRGAIDFTASIQSVVTEIQQSANAFCSCIIMLNRQNETYEILCEQFSDNLTSLKDFYSLLPYRIVDSWEATIGASNCIIVKDEQDLQALQKINPEWVTSLKESYVKNLILSPLKQGKNTIGYIFITNFDIENLVKTKELIELTAFFLASEIATHLLVEKLEHLSNQDLLTGVKNRNSMNTRVDLFVAGEEKVAAPFGVIFADLNGLKQMNDKKGHAAGDVMIKAGAEVLKQIFAEDEIYRAGGDEFVVICPACSEEEFNSKVEELRAKTSFGSKVSLAIGSNWSLDGEDLRRSMHLADEAMYRDKERFYKMHKEVDRRTGYPNCPVEFSPQA